MKPSKDQHREWDERMEQAVWPNGDEPALTKKSVKKQIGRLVECLERITLALQGIDVSLDKLTAVKSDALPSVDE